jgi:hypothetical protein
MGRASQLFENGSDRKELSSFQEKNIFVVLHFNPSESSLRKEYVCKLNLPFGRAM